MSSVDNKTLMNPALPTIEGAWRMTFAELAPCIRDGIKNNTHPRALSVLAYLLSRKIPRKPRSPKLEPPKEPEQKPPRSKWPTLDFKGKNAVLRAQSRRLFMLVDKLAARNLLSNPSLWPSLHKTLIRKTDEERLDIEKLASELLPEQDVLKFILWLRDNHESVLSYQGQLLKYREELQKHIAQTTALQNKHEQRLKHWEKQLGTKFTILAHIQREISEYLTLPGKVVRMPFRIFPADKEGYALLDDWLMNQSRSTGGYEERVQRFEFARSLIPSKWGMGLDDYDGYIIFIFEWTNSVLIEKAQNRNAAYILHREWETLCRLSRRELRTRPKQLWERVIHNNSWQWKRDIHWALQKGRK